MSSTRSVLQAQGQRRKGGIRRKREQPPIERKESSIVLFWSLAKTFFLGLCFYSSRFPEKKRPERRRAWRNGRATCDGASSRGRKARRIEERKRENEAAAAFLLFDCSLSRSFAASQITSSTPTPKKYSQKNSKNEKQATGMLYVDRILYSSVIYPANYGKKEREKEKKREFSTCRPRKTGNLITKSKLYIKNASSRLHPQDALRGQRPARHPRAHAGEEVKEKGEREKKDR